HENTPTGFGERTVQHQDGNDIACPWHRTVADLNAMRGVEANNDASTTVDLAIDPDLPVIVDVRLEPHAGASQFDAIEPRRNLHCHAIPGKRKTYGAALADVVTYLPPRIVIVCQARRGIQDLSGQTFVGLARY